MLHADNVSFGYARRHVGVVTVLHEVSLSIPRGGLVGILGPNGSGKTTLLRVLSGTRRPASGRILLDGRSLDLYPRREVAQRIAVVPQDTELAFEYSVLEMVLMGRHPHLGLFALEGPADFTIAREMLAATGTSDFEDRPFSTLSGGEKQRVVIAAALTQASDVLLLDEPTAALDLAYQLEIASLLSDLNHHRGVTIAISTHDLNLAAAICRELVLLKHGRVLAHGRTKDVLTAANVRELYGVEADVQQHDASGHLIVVPVHRVGS